MEIKGIKGYKVFNPDWTCRNFQYEVGKTFIHNGDIDLCSGGFHFCQKASDCFNYYSFDSNNKVAEIEAVGVVKTDGDKSVTDKITILREILWEELLTIVNEGKNCTGLKNTGNHNTGDCNAGDYNTGDCNAGDYNTGDCNAGDYNTGDCNAGDYNTGDCNAGDYNTGDWNNSNFSSGFFNSVEQQLHMFNSPVDLNRDEIQNLKGMQVLNFNFKNSWWSYSENMTDEEKEDNPNHETTGGYLKTVDFKTACRMMWNTLDTEDKQSVMELPNFDATVFEEITGIKI